MRNVSRRRAAYIVEILSRSGKIPPGGGRAIIATKLSSRNSSCLIPLQVREIQRRRRAAIVATLAPENVLGKSRGNIPNSPPDLVKLTWGRDIARLANSTIVFTGLEMADEENLNKAHSKPDNAAMK